MMGIDEAEQQPKAFSEMDLIPYDRLAWREEINLLPCKRMTGKGGLVSKSWLCWKKPFWNPQMSGYENATCIKIWNSGKFMIYIRLIYHMCKP
jgi:hypothetical protein